MNTLRIVGILLLAVMLTNCKSNAIYNIKYSDQNNNLYLITQDTFLYEPVTKKESSSGVYDGGDPVTKEIDNATFDRISNLVLEIKNDSTQHAAKRKMTFSILVITSGNLNERFFIKPSDTRDQLEELLEEIKTSK